MCHIVAEGMKGPEGKASSSLNINQLPTLAEPTSQKRVRSRPAKPRHVGIFPVGAAR